MARREHFDPFDKQSDTAVLRVEPTAPIGSFAPVLSALLAVRRERKDHPGVEVPVFDVSITPPVPKRKLLLDDEIAPLDVVARAADRGPAIAGAVDPMRAALAKCGAGACSPALRARLLLHLGEALSAAGRREESELAFFDARAVDPDAALDPAATPESARIFGAARKRRLPGVRLSDIQLSSSVSKDAVRAVIAQREGLFRLCYVEGLRRDPKLEGRVSVRLAFGSDGLVAPIVHDGGSDPTIKPVVGCILESFSGLTFPAPESGIDMVTCPIMLTPPRP